MFEDIYFGKTLAESAVKPKKGRKRNCHPATIPHTLTESSSEGESGETPEIVGLRERETAMAANRTPAKRKRPAHPLSDYTSDEEEAPPPALEKVPKQAVKISRVGGDKGSFKIGSTLGTEVSDQRRLMWEIAENMWNGVGS